MICCGYLVTEMPYVDGNTVYAGVDCRAWPLEFIANELTDFSQKLLFSSQYNIHQPFILSLAEACAYQKRCCSLGIMTRILYCKISCEYDGILPVEDPMDSSNHRYLGVDFAYPNETYFSVMRNELLLSRTSFHQKWRAKTNRYGLLPSVSQCIQFMNDRQYFSESASDEQAFEKGPFKVIEVYEIMNGI